MSDRISGGIGMALAVFYIWAATIIPESFMADAIGPKTFPIIVGIVLAICSAYMVLRPDPEPVWPPFRDFMEILLAVAAMLAYAIALPELGFLVSTIFATAYLTWRLGSKPLGAAMTGVATSLGIYVVFHLILGLSLAKGPFGF
ncbi:MAG: putative tricarboxylic transport membrane protein [Limimaricola cinnabarinus]|jgi:putative tricarboxylic transport membrane protein|uniref:tripartite tricarboxylate transporter TctB family protein n=1 Tax=Limimaricola cinnabarinus TaxID=1125964 RepID=UPI0039E5B247